MTVYYVYSLLATRFDCDGSFIQVLIDIISVQTVREQFFVKRSVVAQSRIMRWTRIIVKPVVLLNGLHISFRCSVRKVLYCRRLSIP